MKAPINSGLEKLFFLQTESFSVKIKAVRAAS